MKAIKVITPDQVTDINDYGHIINNQADIIEDLTARLEKLEEFVNSEIKRRTFKKYVVIASSLECFSVLVDQFEGSCNDIVHVNNSMPNVAYYKLNEDILSNGEVIIITRDFFETWKRGKHFQIVTVDELLDILY